MFSKGNHPQMALIQVSEILEFTQIYIYIYGLYKAYVREYPHKIWPTIWYKLVPPF